MTREELEHIIRASGDITDQYEFVIVGSQSILGAVPRPEDVFTVSMEADIYPLQAPELADRIDGAIGEGSQFHETYGYYAQGVGPETALLPRDWMQRVHRIQNGQGRPEDLAKLDNVAENIMGRTICALGDAAAMPVRAMLKHCRHEFAAKIDAAVKAPA